MHADQSKRVFTGYYTSWGDGSFDPYDWSTPRKQKSLDEIYTLSKLAKVPAQYTHVVLSFAYPDFVWKGMAANEFSGTGLDFDSKPDAIKLVVKILHLRNMKVTLAVGGASFNSRNWASLASEAGVANGPIKTAFSNFMKDLDIDGLDVDYEIDNSADPVHVTEYANVIQALREAADMAGPGKLLTIAGWSTGADCTAATTADAWCAGKPASYWGGSAGRERLTFKKIAQGGPHAGKTIGSLLNIVNVMSYDARFEHYDGVTAYNAYRSLVPNSTIVSLGLESAREGWAGAKLVLNNADAVCEGSQILATQYGVANPGPYSVERFGAAVLGSVNVRDGLMLWHIRKADNEPCGSGITAMPAGIGAKVGVMFGLPSDVYPY